MYSTGDITATQSGRHILWNLYGIGVGLVALSVPFFDCITGVGVITAVIAAVIIVISWPEDREIFRFRSSEYALALMVVMAAVSIAAARDRMLAELRFIELLTGAAIFISVKGYTKRNPDSMKSITVLAVLPFSLVVTFSLAQIITGDYVALIPVEMMGGLGTLKGRVSSIFDSPNILAPYLLVTLPFLSAVISVNVCVKKEKSLLLALLSAGLCCLICTYSRNGWIAAILSTVIMALLHLTGRTRRIFTALALILLCILAAACIFKGDTVKSYLYRKGPDRGRMVTYRTAICMLQDQPVRGVGIGNFRTVFPLYFSRGEITFFDGSAAWSADNTKLNFTVETGFPGGTAFVWFITVMLCRLIKGIKREPPECLLIKGCLWSIIAILLFGIFDCTISHHKCGFAFFFIAGCAMGFLESGEGAAIIEKNAAETGVETESKTGERGSVEQ